MKCREPNLKPQKVLNFLEIYISNTSSGRCESKGHYCKHRHQTTLDQNSVKCVFKYVS